MTQVGTEERRDRLGQRGALVDVLAPSFESARDLAFAIERELFNRGRLATVIDSGSARAEAAAACARGGLVALVPAASESFGVSIDGDGLPSGGVTDVDALARRWADVLAAKA